MEDESGIDEKLLAVPTSKIDPTFEEIQDLGDIPKHTGYPRRWKSTYIRRWKILK